MASVPNGNIDQTVTKNKQESQEQAVPLDQATREKTNVVIPAKNKNWCQLHYDCSYYNAPEMAEYFKNEHAGQEQVMWEKKNFHSYWFFIACGSSIF